jgi:hypothetical protein
MQRRVRSYVWVAGGKKEEDKAITKQFNGGENFLKS